MQRMLSRRDGRKQKLAVAFLESLGPRDEVVDLALHLRTSLHVPREVVDLCRDGPPGHMWVTLARRMGNTCSPIVF